MDPEAHLPAKAPGPLRPDLAGRPALPPVLGFSAFQSPANNKGSVCAISEQAWKLLNVKMNDVERLVGAAKRQKLSWGNGEAGGASGAAG